MVERARRTKRAVDNIRGVFFRQALVKEFWRRIVKSNGTSLVRPLQRKGREGMSGGLKKLKKVLKGALRRIKRGVFEEILKDKEESDTEEEVLRGVKLFTVIERRMGREKRRVLQRWRRYMGVRDDLLTVNQSTMHQILRRIVAKFELASLGKKFYQWKYSLNQIETETQF